MYRIKRSEIISIFLLLLKLIFDNFSWGYISSYVIVLVFWLINGFSFNTSLIKRYYKYFIIPNILIFIHAVASLFVYNQTFYFFRSISNFTYIISCILLALLLFKMHKKRAIYVMLTAMLLEYFLRVILCLADVGPMYFIANLFSSSLDQWLEAHDSGLTMGMIVLYLLFFEDKKTKGRGIGLLLATIVFLLCWKRIAIGAFFVSALFTLLFNRFMDKRDRLMKIWGIAGVVLCLSFVFIVRNDFLSMFLWSHGINMMGRDNLYRFFRDYYDFSLNFFGRGSGFTGKLLTLTSRTGDGVGTIVALHSDILRSFIEYGFIGSALWFMYQLLYLPKVFKSIDPRMGQLFFTLQIYAFIVYSTDNTATYMLFQIALMLIPLCNSYDRLSIRGDKKCR